MLTKTVNKLAKSQVEVSITMPWEDISVKWDEVLQRLANDTEVPGFRKGAAPLPMVENSLGNKLQDEFLKVIMPQGLVEALSGTGVVPIDYPQYQLISFSKGQQLNFKATVTERPEIKIVGDYKNLKVTRPALKQITDEDTEKVIADLFKRWKTRNPVGISKPVDGPQSIENQNGASGGSISFNGDQTNSNQTSDTPDDTFAKALGTQSLVDLKTKIKADLEAEAKYNNELDYEEAILQEIEKMTQAELPDILVQDELNRMLVSLQRRVSDMGMLIEDYLKSQNETVDSIKNKWRVQAERNVKMELGLSEVARVENVNISDEDVQAEIDKIQDARMKAQFESEQPRLHLKHNLRQIRTLDLLKKLVNPQ